MLAHAQASLRVGQGAVQQVAAAAGSSSILAGRLAEGAPLGQAGIELADELAGRRHVDAVAHAQHRGDALVDDGLGQGADGAHCVVEGQGLETPA